MIVAFLRAEVDSPRYAKFFPQEEPGRSTARRLVERPNVQDEIENGLRRQLLGYRLPLFQGVRGPVKWQRLELTLEELGATRYANYPTWVELSGHTRLVRDGAKNVGVIVPKEESMEHIAEIETAIADGRSFPELVFLTETEPSAPKDLILAEGHSRATAYVRAGKPDSVEAFVGEASLVSWPFR
jgi:hypothetical protein